MNNRYYEVIGPFGNPSPLVSCATVNVDRWTCKRFPKNTLVHVAAFSKFNPTDIGEGYLDDVAFQFQVPPKESFYVVGQQILDTMATDNGENCIFSGCVEMDSQRCSNVTAKPTEMLSDFPTRSPAQPTE